MKPIGPPPPPSSERVERAASGVGRAADSASARDAGSKTKETGRATDVYTRRAAQAAGARPPSFDTEKVARLRDLADRGACVPSPERIAAALTESCLQGARVACHANQTPASSRAEGGVGIPPEGATQ